MGFWMPYFWIVLPGLILVFWAQWKVHSAFKKFSRIRTFSGLTGAQVAQEIIRSEGIGDVEVRETSGFLGDHYNPLNKTVNLSHDVYRGNSVAAFAVAAHEVGHVIQHARGYKPLQVRAAVVQMTPFASQLGPLFVLFGLFLNATGLIMAGIILFSVFVFFSAITLPVEFDASYRANKKLLDMGLITADESAGVRQMLNAAALTYVAAFVYALLQLLQYVLIFLGRRR
jgi:Zn-dependent membrane protease YugP